MIRARRIIVPLLSLLLPPFLGNAAAQDEVSSPPDAGVAAPDAGVAAPDAGVAAPDARVAVPDTTDPEPPPAQAAPKERPPRRAPRRRCSTQKGFSTLISPSQPIRGADLRIMVVAEKPSEGATLNVDGPGVRRDLATLARGGPPYWWFARIRRPRSGYYRFELRDNEGNVLACTRTRVRSQHDGDTTPAADRQWPVEASWSQKAENLYSAWIEKLFDAPAGEQPTWSPLHQVLRDPERNFLFNHLGASEDGPDPGAAVVVKPDCADLPYFLRAYFAFKMRLPFGFRQCSRGSPTRAPNCSELRSNLSLPVIHGEGSHSEARRLSVFLRRYVSFVHSGAGQTAADDDDTDLYPIALTRQSIRPGMVYVDPSGHLLVVAKWIEQTRTTSGQLLAIESQPDLTVGRKRFWRGAFMYSPGGKGLRAGGFKGFRPLMSRDGVIVALTNDEIRNSPDYGNHSDEQYGLGKEAFYERLDRLINPRPLSPMEAYQEQLTALFELILKRVNSVNTGEAYMQKTSYKVVQMPEGRRIFQTSGPWEDYSTPSRDLRLLMAIDEVLGFPKKVVAHPDRFALPGGKQPAAMALELKQLRQRFAKDKSFSYTRSDSSTATLTMADVLGRLKGLEMAYNPNDCIEIRWAAEGDELSTCNRHAPEAQRRRMEQYRSWFVTRTRP